MYKNNNTSLCGWCCLSVKDSSVCPDIQREVEMTAQVTFSVSLCADSVSSEAAYLEDHVLGVGDILDLSCELEDASEPGVWFKDGARLVLSNRTQLRQNMLRIINVSYEDSGVYSCRLADSNLLLSNYTIKVTGKNRFFSKFLHQGAADIDTFHDKRQLKFCCMSELKMIACIVKTHEKCFVRAPEGDRLCLQQTSP